jgi:photosystem II stability/assembly factor-like uncharacterized protein
MPQLTKDTVLTQQHLRGFIQYGGSGPLNEAQYYGARNQYFFVGGIENPVKGSISPINAPDPMRRKRYERIGRQTEAPDFGSYTLSVAHKHGTLPRVLGDVGCPITLYLSAGRCKNPSDLNRGYESWVYVLSSGEVTDRSNGDMFVMEGDEALMSELTVTTAVQYAIGPLFLGEQAATNVNANVVDAVYAPPNDCIGCQIGNERIYALTQPVGGSPTVQAEVVYSTNGGATWAEVNIAGLGATVVPNAIDIVGEYLVVLSRTAGAHYYATIDPDTGIPGTFSTVTSGYNASGGPNDIYVASSSEIYIVGQGGYIYRATDITAGVTAVSSATVTTQNLQRIHGSGETLVAVGNLGNVIYSKDGLVWATAAIYPTSQTMFGVSVRDEKTWWVGAGNGTLFYTATGGKTWTQVTIPSATQINDIVFATDEVGYVSYDTTGPQGNLFLTIDGGNTWAAATPSVLPARVASSWPVHDRINRIAVPVYAEAGTAANFATLAGLAGDGSDGVIYVAAANIL